MTNNLPENILLAAKKLVEYEHDGSLEADMYWDMLLDDLRESIQKYDKEIPYKSVLYRLALDVAEKLRPKY